jgi:hypothetical protein
MPELPFIKNRECRALIRAPWRAPWRAIAQGSRLAVLLGAMALSNCAPSADFTALAGGGEFNRRDCGASPISGLPFQQCMTSPWLMGSGHASSGGFSAYPTGIRPGSEGGLVNSQQIHAASFSDNAATISVEYAIPRTSLDDFYETTPLNDTSRVGVTCQTILETPCKTGSPIANLRVRDIEINGRSVRLEEFSILGDPKFRSGFVAYIRDEPAPSRPGYRTAMVVRGFLAQPGETTGAVAANLTPLKFQRFALAS